MEEFNDYVFPFSLGCLDKEEKKNLKEFIEIGGEFNFQELGEYQNLVSLLPCILDIETPEPQLKDDVARKLYKLKDEIKANRYKNKAAQKGQVPTKEITRDELPEKSVLENPNEFEDLPLFGSTNNKTYYPVEPESDEDKFPLNDNSKPDENPDFLQENEVKPKSLPVNENKIRNIIRDANPPTFQPETNHTKKNYGIMAVVFLLFFLVVIGLIIGYWKISSDVKEYKKDVEKLNTQINSLTMQLTSSKEIEQMLQSPNVQIINLNGTNLNTSGYGKLIISPEKEHGYIQLSQMPALPEDKTFQLWISVSGNFMPLATFHASEKMEYYSFKMPKLPKGYDVSFLITEEPVGGSKTPGRKVFLTGNL